MIESGRPGPERDPDSETFWAGVDEREVRLQRCLSCKEVRFPPLPSCPTCQADGSETVVASGHGIVYSWIVVRRPLGTISAEEVPYTIATVELEEGPRMVGRLTGTEAPVADMPVEATFWPHDGWTELGFTALHTSDGHV